MVTVFHLTLAAQTLALSLIFPEWSRVVGNVSIIALCIFYFARNRYDVGAAIEGSIFRSKEAVIGTGILLLGSIYFALFL